MTDIKLKSCKCGKTPTVWWSARADHDMEIEGYFVSCENIECQTGEEQLFKTREDAIDAWNTRYTEEVTE